MHTQMLNLFYPVSCDMQYVPEHKYRSDREDAGPARDSYSSETPAGSKVWKMALNIYV